MDIQLTFQLFMATFLIFIFLFISVLNIYFCFFKEASLIPFFGGLFGCVGFFLYPTGQLYAFCWVPLFVDIGCFYLFIGLIDALIRELRS